MKFYLALLFFFLLRVNTQAQDLSIQLLCEGQGKVVGRNGVVTGCMCDSLIYDLGSPLNPCYQRYLKKNPIKKKTVLTPSSDSIKEEKKEEQIPRDKEPQKTEKTLIKIDSNSTFVKSTKKTKINREEMEREAGYRESLRQVQSVGEYNCTFAHRISDLRASHDYRALFVEVRSQVKMDKMDFDKKFPILKAYCNSIHTQFKSFQTWRSFFPDNKTTQDFINGFTSPEWTQFTLQYTGPINGTKKDGEMLYRCSFHKNGDYQAKWISTRVMSSLAAKILCDYEVKRNFPSYQLILPIQSRFEIETEGLKY